MSIVIAAYNAAEWIACAIRSALSQSIGDLEVIVSDDASSDSTIDIVAALAAEDPRVVLLRAPSNGGPAAARNRAFAAAQGEWIAILDADDLMVADRLEKLIAVAEAKKADLVSDDVVLFGGQAGPSRYLRDSTPRWIDARDYLAQGVMFSGGQDYGYLKPVFRKAALERLGLTYDERLRIGEDDDLIVRLLLGGARYWCEPVPGYLYRRHDQSTSHRLSAANAAAMADAAGRLLDRRADGPLNAALRRRWAALRTAEGFAKLVDALKARAPVRALAVLAARPAAIGLLRLPVAARLRRILPLPAVRPRPSDPILAALVDQALGAAP